MKLTVGVAIGRAGVAETFAGGSDGARAEEKPTMVDDDASEDEDSKPLADVTIAAAAATGAAADATGAAGDAVSTASAALLPTRRMCSGFAPSSLSPSSYRRLIDAPLPLPVTAVTRPA